MNEKEKITELKKEEESKTCPKCKKTFTGIGAISRSDNKTEVCSECGTKEALEDFSNYVKGQEKDKKEA